MALTPLQREVAVNTTRFRSLISGRRFGKTFLTVDELLKFAGCNLSEHYGKGFEKNNGVKQKVWYVAPTYRMAKEIAWEMLKDRLNQLRWPYAVNETSLTIKIHQCGSTISLRGADKYDSLRGVGLNFLVMDEFADIAKEAWTEVLRATLSDKHGHALFVGTPKGFNWAYDIHCKGVNGEKDWVSWQHTTLQGGNVPQEEIEAAMLDMDERTFRQEYLASFETYSGVVYYNFNRTQSVVPMLALDDGVPEIHIGMDFNINPMSAIVAHVDENKKVTVFDEIIIYGSDTYEMCDEIRNRYPKHRVFIYPDPACTQGRTSAGGKTDLSILQTRAYGFIVRVHRTHPLVRDRVNAVNSKLKSYSGNRSLFIAKKCRRTIECLERQIYKEGTSVPDKSSGFDHLNDALGYLIEYLFPIAKRMTMSIEI